MRVALTRPREKDAALAEALTVRGHEPLFVPVVAYRTLDEGLKALRSALREDWDGVILTSPEAARRFLLAAGHEPPPLAVVGEGTAEVLRAAGLEPAFMPSRAYAEVLARELPLAPGARWLWPTSARAGRALEAVLTSRGARVRRLDVYTLKARLPSSEERALALSAEAVMLGSPSAAKAWVAAALPLKPAAAIGRITAEAAVKLGFAPVRHPERPGLWGWVEALEALFS